MITMNNKELLEVVRKRLQNHLNFIWGDWDDLLEKGEATEYQIKGVLAQLEVIVK